MADVKALVSRLMTLEDRIIACMRCGNCQAVCPMFGATHMEADVARGKLALVDDLAHELIRDPEAVADKLGRCLLCGSCQANCPSGVKIMDIFMEAREIVYNYLGLSPIKKAIFRVVLAKPKLFNVGMRIGSPVSHILFKKDNTAQQTVNSPLLRPLIGDRHIRSLPNVPLHAKVGNLNEPRKFGGLKIAFYPGCMGDKYYVGMAEACLKVFKHHNVAVYMSSDFACCGIPAVSSGDGKAMVMYLRKNLELLGDVDFDYIVTPCGSCAGTMKEYWPKYAHRIDDTAYYLAKNIAKKTMDVTQFIVDVLGVHAMQPRDNAVDVTYHDSCHLRKGLGVHTQPRELLQANPGYHYVVAPDGKITQLLDEEKISNGVKGFNSVTVNVAYIGGIGADGKATDNRTDEQKKSLRQLLANLKKKYPEAVIQGHRDFSPDANKNGRIEPHEWVKMCPCFDAREEYKDL